MVSIRRADLGLLELRGFSAMACRALVSIRRADLGLLEPAAKAAKLPAVSVFQSAGRIWGFWNAVPRLVGEFQGRFQSAGRIWGFWNGYLTIDGPGTGTVSIRRADLGLLERLFVTSSVLRILFQSAGRIWGFWNSLAAPAAAWGRVCFNPPGGFGAFGTAPGRGLAPLAPHVSIRRADLGLLELLWQQPPGQLHGQCVSIRRADLGLLEREQITEGDCPLHSFNPPGGFGAFGTVCVAHHQAVKKRFQSAGRIWGFWNRFCCVGFGAGFSFNPPGGFGAFGTDPTEISADELGRGFNPPGGFGAFGTTGAAVNIHSSERFQSAGRIWGFWNHLAEEWNRVQYRGFNPPGGFGAFGTGSATESAVLFEEVSIRRADLGLLEPRPPNSAIDAPRIVSIRRADLGLLEPPRTSLAAPSRQFQSAGRIWGFWNGCHHSRCRQGGWFQSAGRIWGFWNSLFLPCLSASDTFQSAGRIWGFWNQSDPLYSFRVQ